MEILEIIFYLFLIMGGVYVLFNINDFFLTWWRWVKMFGSAIVKGLKSLWELILKWIGKK